MASRAITQFSEQYSYAPTLCTSDVKWAVYTLAASRKEYLFFSIFFGVQRSITAHLVIYWQTYGCEIVLGYIGVGVYNWQITGYKKNPTLLWKFSSMIPDCWPGSKCINLQRIAHRNYDRMGYFRSIILTFGEMAGKVFGYTCNSLILCVLSTSVLNITHLLWHAPHRGPQSLEL